MPRLFFQTSLFFVLLLGSGTAFGEVLDWIPEVQGMESERARVEEKRATLPATPPVQLTQRLGWHSEYSSSADKPQRIDSVVLIAPPPNGGAVGAGYGFPIRFYVELLGEGEDPERSIIADFTEADFPSPGLLPVLIDAKGSLAKKVRITATRLIGSKDRFFCALGEVMLLQGNHNLGARLEAIGPAAVLASSSQGTRPDWGRINLVDGHTVLGPPLGMRSSPTFGFRSKLVSEIRATSQPWVEIDLGRVAMVDEVRLFPASPPQFAHSHGYGFPVRYQIELREDDHELPRVLPSPQSGSYSAVPGDNVVSIIGGHRARFVRLNVLDPHVSNGSVVLAMAEMQVWSEGKNIAPGRDVSASDSTEAEGWSRNALVDGFASSADILDWPAWLAGLSKRREVEHQLAMLEAKRVSLAKHWQQLGLGLILVIGALGIVSGVIWLQRQRRARLMEMERLRQRIAQDLHDEIGSSLGSIALIAQDILADDKHVREDLTEIKTIADETVDAMRDITRLMQSERYGTDDLPTLLRETAARTLRGIPHTVSIHNDTQTRRLAVDRQRDLMLMFKEALHNITRHAEATEVKITLEQDHRDIVLTVHDNGHGFDPTARTVGMGLANLRRRATKHQGKVDIDSSTQGTTLKLTLPLYV